MAPSAVVPISGLPFTPVPTIRVLSGYGLGIVLFEVTLQASAVHDAVNIISNKIICFAKSNQDFISDCAFNASTAIFYRYHKVGGIFIRCQIN